MKRPRPTTSPHPKTPISISTPPTTPHTIFPIKTTKKTSSESPITPNRTKIKRNLAPHFAKNLLVCKKPTFPNQPKTPNSDSDWKLLNITKSELFLPLTLPTGQTFRWKQTGPIQYTGVVKSYLFSLKQFENNVGFFVHSSNCSPDNEIEAKTALEDYFNLRILLEEMWAGFIEADSRFAALAPYMGGARVLRQDPVECLFQFLCSSNNNIQRITKMIGFMASFGPYLGNVGGFDFHEFPSLDELAMVSEEHFRKAGFGYRAKYIVGAVDALLSKRGGGAEWLISLRDLELQEVVNALSTLPGVGPKVAACIALFSLDQHHAIPVDTHVWQIATRYLIPELSGARLTTKSCTRVSEAFVSKFGKYAGWAQTVLFIGELPSQKAILPPHLCTFKEAKSSGRKRGKQETTGV